VPPESIFSKKKKGVAGNFECAQAGKYFLGLNGKLCQDGTIILPVQLTPKNSPGFAVRKNGQVPPISLGQFYNFVDLPMQPSPKLHPMQNNYIPFAPLPADVSTI
jgi:hypothetical protein